MDYGTDLTDETLARGFFREDGDVLTPEPIARGPWDPRSLNGRVVAGLLGCEIEHRHGGPDWRPVRLTVDLHRLPGFEPVVIETNVVRDGRRIRVVEAVFVSGGREAARATCQFLPIGTNAPGYVWTSAPWDAPSPAAVEASETRHHPWAMRFFEGRFDVSAPRRAWVRELAPMVGGRPLTPYARVVAACDFASPLVHSGDEGLGYINTDISLHLHRLPASDWIGFETVYHGADDGVAVGECRLHDERGSIGLVTCSALAQARPIIPR